jgi:membrane associated rhomboid family serine protease
VFDEFKNAFQRHNNAHVQLIIINAIFFVVMAVFNVIASLSNNDQIFDFIVRQIALSPDFSVFIQKPWTIITYAFIHSFTDIFHLFFNMLIFYWIAKIFIEYLGSDKLLAVYILGVLAGALFLLITHNSIPFYIERNAGLALGASAAVNAVLIATATLLPEYTIFLFLIGPVRLKYVALFYVIASFAGSVGSNAGGDVAHLGGALMGYIYVKQLQVGVNWGGWITVTLDWFKGLFKPSPKVKVSYRKTDTQSQAMPKTKPTFTKATQEEIDMILDKISDKGYESLSKEEKEKLFNASKK